MSLARSLTRRINPSTTAFFLCDVQERFRSVIHAYPHVISVAQKAVQMANIVESPVVVTEQYPKAFGPTVEEIDINNAALRVEKTKFSMLVPEVHEFLKEKKLESVVLFGIEAHVCVLQTALDLLDNNYNVHVLSDGVSSANHPEIDIALTRMRQAGAAITTSDSMLFQLIGDSSHPKFKQMSQLLKDWQGHTLANQLLFRASNI
ncbi:Isochorismatase-like protein [Syncephalis fuscata]|nr:Isochorismatase-like protein [Syncephalis fuscata]